MQKPSLLILAAGLGSRYKGCKQVEPIGPFGAALYDYAVYDARRAGFEQVVFVINRQMDDFFKKEIKRKYGSNAPFNFVYQELDSLPAGFTPPLGRAKPWGTGHAVLTARDALHAPFIAINADDYYGPSSYQMIASELRSLPAKAMDQVMVGFEIEKTLSAHGEVSRGACEVQNGRLVSIEEREHIHLEDQRVQYRDPQGRIQTFKPGTLVSMNFWGFAPQTIFPILERGFQSFLKKHGSDLKAEFYLPAAVNQAIESGEIRVKVLPTAETWMGMTYAEDRAEVRRQIRAKIEAGIYPEKIFD
ncbi:MAG: nucleotidyltransferase [Desulfobacteraceae bacterium]|nr:MAG: nucleotidyltransferase [Desulfobacteraceae bacterium]